MRVGIEIGGTKLQIGVGPGDGTLVGLWRGTVDLAGGAEGIRHRIVAAYPEALDIAKVDRSAIRSVGVGFGGPVDDATRGVLKSHQVGGWDGFPLGDWLESSLGVPCAVGNDADVAGLAEAHFGAGRGMSPIFYMTIGSGIGGGLILDGRIHRGVGKGAAEVGHLRLPFEGGRATLEAIASGWAIEAAAARLFAGPRRSCRELATLAEAGDMAVTEFLYERWSALADAIRHVIALVCPRRIVIGGGVSMMGEKVLFGPLRRLVAAEVFAPFADAYEIVPAALGEEVVVHGALALARQLTPSP